MLELMRPGLQAALKDRLRWSLAVLLAVIGGGCSDGAGVLWTEDGRVALRYRCSDLRPLARTEGDRALVRAYAVRIVQRENAEGRIEPITPIVRAYDAGEFPEVERLVADCLCREPFRLADDVARFPAPGSHPPDFLLAKLTTDGSGGQVSLEDHRGQYVLLDFWGSWCAPCTAKYPDLVRIAHDYRDRNLVVYGVLHRESPARAMTWLEANGGMEYPFLIDPGSRVGREFGVRGLPHVFLIDPEGTVVSSWLGSLALESVRKTLEEIL